MFNQNDRKQPCLQQWTNRAWTSHFHNTARPAVNMFTSCLVGSRTHQIFCQQYRRTRHLMRDFEITKRNTSYVLNINRVEYSHSNDRTFHHKPTTPAQTVTLIFSAPTVNATLYVVVPTHLWGKPKYQAHLGHRRNHRSHRSP